MRPGHAGEMSLQQAGPISRPEGGLSLDDVLKIGKGGWSSPIQVGLYRAKQKE
jgi:hypothetical protein